MKYSLCSLAVLLALAGQAALPPSARAGDERKRNSTGRLTGAETSAHYDTTIGTPGIASYASILHGKSAAAQEFLRVHNDARAKVGAPPLHWSETLARRAQQWANQLAATGQFQHHPQTGPKIYGENLFGGSHGFGPADAARYWLEERASYFGGPYHGAAGHYTQMIWSDTTEVGFGAATGAHGVVIVGNYYPSGNILGVSPYLKRRRS